ncbi:MAG: hypothetical protein K6U04_15725 [Armatimonadetes bacterium]|nr:hypothetical protein [Armatimonadota bacterium]
MAGNRLIEIKMSKCVIYLYERELAHLLSLNPELWAASIRRGKAIRRAAVAEKREEVNFNADGIKNYAGRRSVNRNCLRR